MSVCVFYYIMSNRRGADYVEDECILWGEWAQIWVRMGAYLGEDAHNWVRMGAYLGQDRCRFGVRMSACATAVDHAVSKFTYHPINII